MPTKKIVEAEEKKLLIRLPKELHRQARLLSFELNVSMAELCRQGLELIMQKHQKSLAIKKEKSK